MIDKSLFTLPGAKKILGILAVCGLLQAFCIAGQAFALSTALTNVWLHEPLSDQVWYLAVFLTCFIARQVIVFGQDSLLESYASKRGSELRMQLLESVFATQAQVVQDAGTARVTSAALEGIDQVETYLRVILPKIINVVVIPVVLLITVARYDMVSALVLLLLFPIIIFYMIMLGRMAQSRAAAQYETYNQMSNHFIDTLRGIETLKYFGASRSYGSTIYKVSERFRIATIDTLKVATLSGMVLDLIATLGVAAVAVLLGFRLLNDQMALLNALAALILAPEYFKPVRDFASDFHASLDGKNALADIRKLISQAQSAKATQTAPNLAPWNEHSQLTLRDICFSYPPKEDTEQASYQALCDINLDIAGTANVGIVGASGSGKTTLVGLLGGFHVPEQGQIEIDGVPLESLRCAEWQNQILYIPQHPYMFHATLRENLCFYSPQATEEEIAQAIAVVGLDQLVGELPEGLDTIIGEGGRGLSGGQAHRIALARALLDPTRRVLIFDEPTAHLDIETEYELKARMLPIMQDRLVLFATHRLHWLTDMDWIVVMDQGRIVEQGTFENLMHANGALAELVSQARGGAA